MPGKCYPPWLFALGIFDVLDDIADSLQFLRLLVGDFVAELLLQGHDQFDRVQGIGAQILDELGLGSHLVPIDAELFDDDFFYSLFSCLFSSHDFAPFLFVSLYARRLKASSLDSLKLSNHFGFTALNALDKPRILYRVAGRVSSGIA